MSTSLLYHGFGIQGYQHVHTKYHDGAIHYRVRQEVFSLRCPECGSYQVKRRGLVMRRFRTLPIGSKPVWIELAVQRVLCLLCGVLRQVKVNFAAWRRSYTRAFERYALELSRHMTIKDAARHLGMSWDVIKDIQKRSLKRRFARPKLHQLKQIAIDEISIGKGHRYLTIVLDLKSGAVVFVGEGKGAEALEPFWPRLRRQKVHIEAVATDLSPAYISAVLTHLPNAVHVFDHFHIIKLYNEGLSGLRRQLYHEATHVMDQKVLKGTRWLLLKNPENLDPNRRETERLAAALQLNQPLALAYYLKEDLRQLWLQEDKTTAAAILQDWVDRATASGIPMLIKFAKTMCLYRRGILAYYDYPISTGPLEGTNNKIKTMKRQAYGFRDQEFFKLKILALHETRYALVG
ncbi:MAG: ISL3 family transposase [Chloroflexi bacterium]|nr:ISL3 family transposase [Chloroflexota bacterium]